MEKIQDVRKFTYLLANHFFFCFHLLPYSNKKKLIKSDWKMPAICWRNLVNYRVYKREIQEIWNYKEKKNLRINFPVINKLRWSSINRRNWLFVLQNIFSYRVIEGSFFCEDQEWICEFHWMHWLYHQSEDWIHCRAEVRWVRIWENEITK